MAYRDMQKLFNAIESGETDLFKKVKMEEKREVRMLFPTPAEWREMSLEVELMPEQVGQKYGWDLSRINSE